MEAANYGSAHAAAAHGRTWQDFLAASPPKPLRNANAAPTREDLTPAGETGA